MAERGRAPSPEFDPKVRVRPTASPVDTYSRPALPTHPEDNPAHRLAVALKEINPRLTRFSNEVMEARAREDVERGREAALKSALAYKEAVEKGVIRPNESPWFVKAYKEQQGRAIGTGLEVKARMEWAKWADKDSDDPQAFSKWWGEFLQRELEPITDQDVMVGVTKEIQQLQQQMAGMHSAYTGERVKKGLITAGQSELVDALTAEWDAARSEGRDINTSAIAARINQIGQRMRLAGVSGQEINDSITDIVIAKAEEIGDADLMDVLLTKRPDGTPGPGSTSKNFAAIQAGKQRIFSSFVAKANYLDKLEERAKKEKAEGFLRDGLMQLRDNPYHRFDRGWLEQASRVDPDIARTLTAAQEAFISADQREDPTKLHSHLERMFTDHSKTPFAVIKEAIDAGAIRSVATMTRALDDARIVAEGRKRNIMSDTTVSAALRRVQALGNKDPEMPGIPTMVDPRVSQEAAMEFTRHMHSWAAKHPDALPMEVAEEALKVEQFYTKWAHDRHAAMNAKSAPQQQQQPARPGADAARKALQRAQQAGDQQAVNDILTDFPELKQ
ncbi:MAG: hypothetical protein ACK4FJ_18580 [Ferrovibrio sp.]|uniref:hypothetical protein n=1 Tax=Ferrovibrio sp. TaxID=1917215 RepID=UPI00391D134B